MCTAYFKKSKSDTTYGYNLDIDPDFWHYKLVKNSNCFAVAITVGATTYLTHGVNKRGEFINLPYMNGDERLINSSLKKERIDLMTDRLLRGKYTFSDIEKIIDTKKVVNAKNLSMHSLICNREGRALIVEPEYGVKEIKEDFALLTNFPVLDVPKDDNAFYGKERYKNAQRILKNSGKDFSAYDGLKLLKEVKESGKWATRLSFVYSVKDNSIYYVENCDFENIKKHCF